jgi:hypothetical protein
MRTSHPERRTPTFRHVLLVMGAATWLALVLPVGARATGQLVTLVDPSTSSKAHVDDGKLLVGDGQGSLTVNGSVRDADQPGRHVYQQSTGLQTHPTPLGTMCLQFGSVPAGNRLEIDFVTFEFTSQVQPDEAWVRANGSKYWIDFVLVSTNHWQVSETTDIYFDAARQGPAICAFHNSTNDVVAGGSITGHLIPLP